MKVTFGMMTSVAWCYDKGFTSEGVSMSDRFPNELFFITSLVCWFVLSMHTLHIMKTRTHPHSNMSKWTHQSSSIINLSHQWLDFAKVETTWNDNEWREGDPWIQLGFPRLRSSDYEKLRAILRSGGECSSHESVLGAPSAHTEIGD